LRVIRIIVQVRGANIYVAAVEALRKKERQDGTPKLVENLFWIPVISF
jgi:hypothetical protein